MSLPSVGFDPAVLWYAYRLEVFAVKMIGITLPKVFRNTEVDQAKQVLRGNQKETYIPSHKGNRQTPC